MAEAEEGRKPGWLEEYEAGPSAPAAERPVGGPSEPGAPSAPGRPAGGSEPSGAAEGAGGAPAARPVADAPRLPTDADDAALTGDLELEEAGISRLREAASSAARRDAAAGVPALDGEGTAESEQDLIDRCGAFFDRWSAAARRQLEARLARKEEEVADRLGQSGLALDRFERLTNELIRVKARLSRRREQVSSELDTDEEGPTRGLSTRVYLAALFFLGLVEFFANSPVFSALLPRDPLTERQIRLIFETSQGWMAGAERVFAQLILRPDAALLAAGVVTFLCVLAHFFGHSLRAAVIQKDQEERFHVAGRSQIENVIPMVLSGLGLLLVIGVLYEARLTLGEVGEQQYNQDMAVVAEWQRQAGFLRADGELLEANQLLNQASDMQGAAEAMLEYSRAMSRLSFPILLLNSTLVLCAISAAYFHRRDRRRERFSESPFERERHGLIQAAESTAEDVSGYLSAAMRDIRELQSLAATPLTDERRAVLRQLESVIALYRAENGRARSLDPRAIPAFQHPVSLGVDTSSDGTSLTTLRSPAEYDEERQGLRQRFETVRQRFNEEALSW